MHIYCIIWFENKICEETLHSFLTNLFWILFFSIDNIAIYKKKLKVSKLSHPEGVGKSDDGGVGGAASPVNYNLSFKPRVQHYIALHYIIILFLYILFYFIIQYIILYYILWYYHIIYYK